MKKVKKKPQKVKVRDDGKDQVLCTLQVIALANGGLAIQLVEQSPADGSDG